jgi:hypothetical protein
MRALYQISFVEIRSPASLALWVFKSVIWTLRATKCMYPDLLVSLLSDTFARRSNSNSSLKWSASPETGGIVAKRALCSLHRTKIACSSDHLWPKQPTAQGPACFAALKVDSSDAWSSGAKNRGGRHKDAFVPTANIYMTCSSNTSISPSLA